MRALAARYGLPLPPFRRAATGDAGGQLTRPVRRYQVTTFGCQMNAHDSSVGRACSSRSASGRRRPRPRRMSSSSTRARFGRSRTAVRGAHGQREGAEASQPGRVSPWGAAPPRPSGEPIFELYPGRRRVRRGLDPHLAEWIGANGEGVERGAFGTGAELVSADAAAPPRAPLPGVGRSRWAATRSGRLLHRPGRPRPRGQPPPGGDRRRGDAAGPRGRARVNAARPERQLLGPRPSAGLATEFGELARVRRGRRHRADPVHGPHPKDFRDSVIAAMAECARSASTSIYRSVRLEPHAQGDAPHVRP